MAQMGRPRNFDRSEAVERAMLLFWEHGYESTSLTRLREGIGGISAASFYAAFDSKEALFKEVVDRYVASYGQVTRPLWNDAMPPRKALEQALRNSARMQTDRKHPQGCLLVVAANTCSPENSHIQALLAKERARTRNGMRYCLARARQCGDLSPAKDVGTLTAVYDTFLFGITTQARDRTPLAALERAVAEVMTLWDDPESAHAET
ncbi:TetR/AcrR family transcriptional regulator [Xanthomonas hyacinthi]|uniref:TetR family transcriptional regulator n=4 Tax=Xanthomonas hyacinthi TaxID=56455 RepID=A0A2S7EXF8_9XANT|nr:TetR family transcriptional regulator [Xanthomonas hyacinthi]QGY76629.1 TetR/AcrR family transcriptional regulator [Xanthomonas hyacinthi]